MTEMPHTQYARSGDVHIAYQVMGDGPIDVVLVHGFVSHLELAWDDPQQTRFLRRLASFSRLIRFDKRGTGLSDPVSLNQLPTLEQRMDDVRAVLDAVGSERAAFFGISEGGPMSLLFAATHAARTRALVLYGSYARMTWAADYPWGVHPDAIEKFLGRVETGWGTGAGLTALWPSRAGDAELRERWARFQRLAASPGAAIRLLRMSYETDCRPVLSSITCPTLVVHRVGDRFVACEHGRHLAECIPGARYVELQGADHPPWAGDAVAVLEEIEEFLTGSRHGAEPDRVLATVLFTDIVGSTERAAALGDRRWRDLLGAYYGAARRQVARFRGRELDTAGDGLLAAFDGPARAIRCGCAIRDAVRPLGLEVRAGLHTGECEPMGDKLSGIAVHIGARVAAHAGVGEVLVSGTVKDLVAGSGIHFEDRGVHELRGVPGEWRLFAVAGESGG